MTYEKPELTRFGPVGALTGAVGAPSEEDVSDFSEDTSGSIDQCEYQDGEYTGDYPDECI